MVDVIELQPGQALPDGEVSVLVGPVEDGGGLEPARSWTYFSYLPDVPGAREARIAEAKRYAEAHGIGRVHVIEVGPAEQAAAGETGFVMPVKAEAEAP